MNDDLTDKQKNILFAKDTEPPFTGTLLEEKRDGSYACANCGTVVFSSDTKYESGSGWPSFTEPANAAHVNLSVDTTYDMTRTEVSCAKCGGHLGHVFDDGPAEHGGQRYCVNSLSLAFEPSNDSKN